MTMENAPIEFDPTVFGYSPGEELSGFSRDEAFWMGTRQGQEAAIRQLQHPGNCETCGHKSDCALHSRPSMPVEPCNCKPIIDPTGSDAQTGQGETRTDDPRPYIYPDGSRARPEYHRSHLEQGGIFSPRPEYPTDPTGSTKA